jgi:hypothetical protein
MNPDELLLSTGKDDTIASIARIARFGTQLQERVDAANRAAIFLTRTYLKIPRVCDGAQMGPCPPLDVKDGLA